MIENLASWDSYPFVGPQAPSVAGAPVALRIGTARLETAPGFPREKRFACDQRWGSLLSLVNRPLDDVCSQFANDRTITLCVWDAPSSRGVQVADYGLWATQRVLENRECSWYAPFVLPTLGSLYAPWGRA